MLTLRRFKALAESYGANPARWPEPSRTDAEALLRLSPQARAIVEREKPLDDALDDAAAREDAVAPSDQTAALARLRSGVGARIATLGRDRERGRRFGSVSTTRFGAAPVFGPRRLATAAAAGLVVAAGIWFGSQYAAPSKSGDVLAMLQPAPLHFLLD